MRELHPAPGVLVGRFRLVRLLGSGGTGDVWLADDDLGARPVALKLPHPDHVRDEATRHEFLREARAGSMLDHPGIATVYDVGESPCGPYIAMEYVAGPSLRAHAAGRRIAIEQAATWIAGVADALGHAHAHHVVHGDVSPGNLLLDASGALKLVDFGLARTLLAGTDTTRSQIRGTLPYMAPELLRGHRADARTDLYAVGVVLYHLLTAEFPYPGRRPEAYLHAVVDGRPRDPREFEPAISPALAALLLRALDPDAELRAPGARWFAQELRTISLRAVPGDASPTTATRPVGESPAPDAPPAGDLPRLDPGTQALVEARLLQAQALLRRPDQEASVDAALGALESLHRLAPGDTEVLSALARACLYKGQLARDDAWEDRAEDYARRAEAIEPDRPSVLLAAADLDRIQGREEVALQRYRTLLEREPGSIEGWVGLSWAHERRGELDEAESAARSAIAAAPGDWRGHSRLGGFFLNRGAYDQALPSWQSVVELAPDHARGWSSLGSALFQIDRLEESLEAFERSIRLQPTAVGFLNAGTVNFYLRRYADSLAHYERAVAVSPSDARAWGNYGSAARLVPGAGERARTAFERAVVLMRAHLDRHPDDVHGWAWLANWLVKCGRAEESRTALERALALDPERARSLSIVPGTYELLGDPATAIALFRHQVEQGSGIRWLEADPSLDRLRASPEWQEVVAASRRRAGRDTATPD